MSLAIDLDTIMSVLLPDGKWHDVQDCSFDLDSYEFMHGERTIAGGGTVQGVSSTGAKWKEKGEWYVCPLTSIIALRYRQDSAPKRQGVATTR